MRQREIKRIEKLLVEICRYNYGSAGDIGAGVVHPTEHECPSKVDGKCDMDGRKCDAVKFQLKEVKDGV